MHVLQILETLERILEHRIRLFALVKHTLFTNQRLPIILCLALPVISVLPTYGGHPHLQSGIDSLGSNSDLLHSEAELRA
jgi:hypothetical protein